MMADNVLKTIEVDKLLREYEVWFLRYKDVMLQEDFKLFFVNGSIPSLFDIVDEPENVLKGLFPKFLEVEKGFEAKIIETVFFNTLFKIFQEKAERSLRFYECFKRLITNSVNGIYIKWKMGEEIDKRVLIEEAITCVYLITNLIPYVGLYLIGLSEGDFPLIVKCDNKLVCLSVVSSMKAFLAFVYLKSQLLRDARFKKFFTRSVFSEAEALLVYRKVLNEVKDDGKVALKMAIFIDNFMPKLWEAL